MSATLKTLLKNKKNKFKKTSYFFSKKNLISLVIIIYSFLPTGFCEDCIHFHNWKVVSWLAKSLKYIRKLMLKGCQHEVTV